jgi:hypothetical protein
MAGVGVSVGVSDARHAQHRIPVPSERQPELLRGISVAHVTMLKLTVPATVDIEELEHEIVTAVTDRLRDDHGYQLMAGARPRASETANTYRLHPTGIIVVDKDHGVLEVKLHGINVDADDLFTAVSSEMEQRHDGLGVEIG